jgi:SAM-dependent MidA family methyltransferase
MPATPLDRIVREIILGEGPLPVDRFFALVLSHPEFGYYMSRQPFGIEGDFITAPEASQMFGELVGIWLATVYETLGAPARINLVEVGPGQGVLMADILRAAKVMPAFQSAIQVHLVETSPRLRIVQENAVARQGFDVCWHEDLNSVPAGPVMLIGNEFFDALPVRQLQRQYGRWHERHVGLDSEGQYRFVLNPQPIPDELVPSWAADAGEGAIAEIAPARNAMAEAMGKRLAADPGAAIFIDYGHTTSAPGDTLQAMRSHAYVDVFTDLGTCDLTSHVDFEELAKAMTRGGAKVLPVMTQAQFLRAMGVELRAAELLERANADEREGISFNLNRLLADDLMGRLFKVMAAVSPGVRAPYPFGGA